MIFCVDKMSLMRRTQGHATGVNFIFAMVTFGDINFAGSDILYFNLCPNVTVLNVVTIYVFIHSIDDVIKIGSDDILLHNWLIWSVSTILMIVIIISTV